MAEEDWYVSRAGQQVGPMSQAEIEQYKGAGKLAPTDFVWTARLGDWQPASDVFSFGAGLMPPPLPVRQPPPLPAATVKGISMRKVRAGFHLVMLALVVISFMGGFSPPRTGSFLQDNTSYISPLIGTLVLWVIGAIVLRFVAAFVKE